MMKLASHETRDRHKFDRRTMASHFAFFLDPWLLPLAVADP